jgi:hypothetical protein
MSAIDEFDTITDELAEACGVDHADTERLLDELLGRHEDDDFPASSNSEFLIGLED